MEIKLTYGEHVWPEISSRLAVTPYFYIPGAKFNMAQAMRRGPVRKVDKTGIYKIEDGVVFVHLNIVFENPTVNIVSDIFLNTAVGSPDSITTLLYPPDVATLCSESGYHLVAHLTQPMSYSDIIRCVKTHRLPVESFSEQSVANGIAICRSTKKESSTKRFGRI